MEGLSSSRSISTSSSSATLYILRAETFGSGKLREKKGWWREKSGQCKIVALENWKGSLCGLEVLNEEMRDCGEGDELG